MQLDLPDGVNFIILLTVLGAVGYRVSSPAERERALQYLRHLLAACKTVMLERREGLHEFRLAVRARTSRPVVTPALVAIWVAVFVGLLFGAAPTSDADALLGWGASLGTRIRLALRRRLDYAAAPGPLRPVINPCRVEM